MVEGKFEGFDRVFPLIGGHNQYQWLLLGIVSLQGALTAFHHLGYVFLGAVPDHWCEIAELQNTNWTIDQIKNISIPRKLGGIEFEKCTYYDLDYLQIGVEESYDEVYATLHFDQADKIPCTKWTYDKSIYESTTVTQFNLVCDRNYLVATIQAAYMGGGLVGSFALAGLSDGVLGRRRVVLLALSLVLIGGFGAGLSTSYMSFVICRVFVSIGVTGSMQNCFTLMMEYSDTSYRAIIGMMQSIPFSIGYMIMPLYAYFIRDWSNLQLAFTASALVLLSYIWILPESCRWLVSKGRDEEAIKVLKEIAKRNNRPELDMEIVQEIFVACKQEFGDKFKTKDEVAENIPLCKRWVIGFKNFLRNYLRLVETPELRKRSIIIWFLYAAVSFVYYGVLFGSATLTNDPFLLVFLGGLMEVPGLIGLAPFAARWGRTPTVASAFLLSGVAIIAVSLVPLSYPALRVILAMSGKLFISGCFGVIFVLSTELYPTQTRACGLGFAALMGRFGSILAPYVVNQMKDVYTDLPSIIFGVTGIIAGVVAFLLPETKDVELLESVKAIEIIRRVSVPYLARRRESVKSLRRKSQIEISDKNEIALTTNETPI